MNDFQGVIVGIVSLMVFAASLNSCKKEEVEVNEECSCVEVHESWEVVENEYGTYSTQWVFDFETPAEYMDCSSENGVMYQTAQGKHYYIKCY